MFKAYKNVALVGANFQPAPEWLTTEQMEQELSPLYEKLKLSPGRLELMTGIKRRGVFAQDALPSDLALSATLSLLEKVSSIAMPKPIARKEIDLLIYAGVSRDCLEPATATRVHHKTQLSAHCQNFDLSNACLGVMSAVEVASKLIESKMIRYALITSGENATPLLRHTIQRLLQGDPTQGRQELKKAFASLTIGSGAVAWILGPADQHPDAPRMAFTHSMARSQATYLCQGDGNREGMWMETDAEALLEQGLELASAHWQELQKHAPDWATHYDHLFMHQVGRAHEVSLTKRLNLDPSKQWSLYEDFGNMGSVALPATWIRAQEQGIITTSPSRTLLLGIGSGLNSMICGIQVK